MLIYDDLIYILMMIDLKHMYIYIYMYIHRLVMINHDQRISILMVINDDSLPKFMRIAEYSWSLHDSHDNSLLEAAMTGWSMLDGEG